MQHRFVVAAGVATLLVSATASADVPEPRNDAEVQRLLSAKNTLRWMQGRYGHAETLVQAPPSRIGDVLSDLAHYKDLNRKFASARVVAREGDSTDLYLKVPVKIGFFTVNQWEVMRFGPVKEWGSGRALEARALRGTMKDGHVRFTVRPVDAAHSILKVDVFLAPGMPAPQSLVDEELRDAAFDLANGLKDRSQGWSGPVTAL
jgi:Polyketide cyclase / dehydrase and lipid transport